MHLVFEFPTHPVIGKFVRSQHLNLAQQCHRLYRMIPL